MQITATQQVVATLTITDKKGNPAQVEGPPVWASSDETVLLVVPAADGLSAVLKGNTPGGPARASVTADADLGEGVSPIVGTTESITVVAGTAVVVNLTLSDPTEQEDTPPPSARSSKKK